MKGKINSIGRVIIALVLVAGLSLVPGAALASETGNVDVPEDSVPAGTTDYLVLKLNAASADSILSGVQPDAGTEVTSANPWTVGATGKVAFVDGGTPGLWEVANDLILFDSDKDSVYTSAADFLVDANGAEAGAGTTTISAGADLFDVVEGDNIVADDVTSAVTKVWQDSDANLRYVTDKAAETAVVSGDGDIGLTLTALTNAAVTGSDGAWGTGEAAYVDGGAVSNFIDDTDTLITTTTPVAIPFGAQTSFVIYDTDGIATGDTLTISGVTTGTVSAVGYSTKTVTIASTEFPSDVPVLTTVIVNTEGTVSAVTTELPTSVTTSITITTGDTTGIAVGDEITVTAGGTGPAGGPIQFTVTAIPTATSLTVSHVSGPDITGGDANTITVSTQAPITGKTSLPLQSLTNGKVTGTDGVWTPGTEYVYDDVDTPGSNVVGAGDNRLTAISAETIVLGTPLDGDTGTNVAATAGWVKENSATWTPGDDIFIENVAGELTYSADADAVLAGSGTPPDPGDSLVTANPWTTVNGVVFYDAGTPGVWEAGADAIINEGDGDNVGEGTEDFGDDITGLSVENAGSLAATYFNAVKLWRDGGNGNFDAGNGDDTLIALKSSQSGLGQWEFTSIGADQADFDIGDGTLFFIAVDLSSSAPVGETIKMRVPPAQDGDGDNAFDAGIDRGIFYEQEVEEDGGLENAYAITIGTAGLPGHGDGNIDTDIGGAAFENLVLGRGEQSLGLIRIKDISSEGGKISGTTVLSLPDGVEFNTTASSGYIVSTSEDGGVEIASSQLTAESLTICHTGASNPGEILKVSGLWVDVYPKASAADGGQANAIAITYSEGTLNSNLLKIWMPSYTLGAISIPAKSSNQAFTGNLVITLDSFAGDNDLNQVGSGTSITLALEADKGITWSSSMVMDNLVLGANADPDNDGTVEIDDASATISEDGLELSIPVVETIDTDGATITIDATELLVNATAAASDADITVKLEGSPSTGIYEVERAGKEITITKPDAEFGVAAEDVTGADDDDSGLTGSDFEVALGKQGVEGPSYAGNNYDLWIESTTDEDIPPGSAIRITINSAEVSFSAVDILLDSDGITMPGVSTRDVSDGDTLVDVESDDNIYYIDDDGITGLSMGDSLFVDSNTDGDYDDDELIVGIAPAEGTVYTGQVGATDAIKVYDLEANGYTAGDDLVWDADGDSEADNPLWAEGNGAFLGTARVTGLTSDKLTIIYKGSETATEHDDILVQGVVFDIGADAALGEAIIFNVTTQSDIVTETVAGLIAENPTVAFNKSSDLAVPVDKDGQNRVDVSAANDFSVTATGDGQVGAGTYLDVNLTGGTVTFTTTWDVFIDQDGTSTRGRGIDGHDVTDQDDLTNFDSADKVYWVDEDGSGSASPGDEFYLDANGDGNYDNGEAIYAGADGAVSLGGDDSYSTSANALTAGAIKYYDADGGGAYDSGEDIIAELGQANGKYDVAYALSADATASTSFAQVPTLVSVSSSQIRFYVPEAADDTDVINLRGFAVDAAWDATDTRVQVITRPQSGTDIAQTAENIIDVTQVTEDSIAGDAQSTNDLDDFDGELIESTDTEAAEVDGDDALVVGSTQKGAVKVENTAEGMAYGGAVVNLEIIEQPEGAEATLSTNQVTTVQDGTAEFEIGLGSVAGDYKVKASLDVDPMVSVILTWQAPAGSATHLVVENMENALRNPGTYSSEQYVAVMKVSIRDAGGNLVTNQDVDVAVILSGSAQLDTTVAPGSIYEGFDSATGEEADEAISDTDGDGRYNYVAGEDANTPGDFYIFISDTLAEEVSVTVIPQSTDIARGSANTTFYSISSADISFSTDDTVILDTEVEVTGMVLDAAGNVVQVPRLSVNFSSSDESVATLDAASADTDSEGKAMVTATAVGVGSTDVSALISSSKYAEKTLNVVTTSFEILPDTFLVEPTEGVAPLDITASVDITNTGNYAEDCEAQLYVDDVPVGNSVAQTIAAGETKTFTFAHTFAEAGTYGVKIVGLTDITTGEVTPASVTVLTPAGFTLDNLAVDPTSGVAPLSIDVSCDVTNTGDVSGDYTAELKVDGAVVDSQVVTVAAGATETVTFESYELTDPGIYQVTIDDLDAIEVTVSEAAVEYVTWNCPWDHEALISPNPGSGRPFLTTSADLSAVTTDADWFQVLWLDESTGEYSFYLSEFTTGNTLTTLEPGKYYYVIVSAPCELTIPQGD